MATVFCDYGIERYYMYFSGGSQFLHLIIGVLIDPEIDTNEYVADKDAS